MLFNEFRRWNVLKLTDMLVFFTVRFTIFVYFFSWFFIISFNHWFQGALLSRQSHAGRTGSSNYPQVGKEAHMAIFAAVTLNFLLVPFLNRVWIVGSSSDTKDKELIDFSMPAINQRIQTTSSDVNLKKELAARRWRPFADIESGNSKHREYPKRRKPHPESSKITRELFSAPFCQINNS